MTLMPGNRLGENGSTEPLSLSGQTLTRSINPECGPRMEIGEVFTAQIARLIVYRNS